MSNPTIVCAGEVMIEMAAVADTPNHFQQALAGDSFNTAIYLARSGLPVTYLTKLGDDLFSSAIIEKLHQEGVGSDMIARLAGRKPGLYLVRNDSDGERHFTYWRENSPARELFDEPVQLPDTNVFYFTGVTIAVTRNGHAHLLTLLKQLAKSGCRIVFDPNYRPGLWPNREQAEQHYRAVLPFCDTVLPTLDDETALWGTQTVDECHAFYDLYNVSELVIKAPDLTVTAFVGDQRVQRQAKVIKAIDTTGAGDAFNAAYLAGRLSGLEPGAAIDAGQDLAARVVQHLGALVERGLTATT
ncbi:MAG: sugar kinase [Gammaproteobacteria bacterium]